MSITLLTGPEITSASGITKRLVIFLHGFGSNGDDLLSLAELMLLPDTHYISPHAPFRFDMADFGYQWFSLDDRSPAAMLAGAQIAAPILNAFIDAQITRFGITDKDVALVGFSQGTMMALYAGLRRPKALGAMIGFSGALVAPPLLAAEIQSRPPVCLIHGAQDMVVPFGAMAQAEDALHAAGVRVETLSRPTLGHGIDPEGIEIALAFLEKAFGG